MEIWDAYDSQGNLLDITLKRGCEIPEGMYHIVCEVLIQHCDGDYLLMQRDFTKPSFPGKFEASLGGSALKGETAVECALREAKEETGLDIDELIIIDHNFHKEDRCIWHTFYGKVSQPKESVMLQELETIDYRWLSKEEMIVFIHSDDAIREQIDRFKKYYISNNML